MRKPFDAATESAISGQLPIDVFDFRLVCRGTNGVWRSFVWLFTAVAGDRQLSVCTIDFQRSVDDDVNGASAVPQDVMWRE